MIANTPAAVAKVVPRAKRTTVAHDPTATIERGGAHWLVACGTGAPQTCALEVPEAAAMLALRHVLGRGADAECRRLVPELVERMRREDVVLVRRSVCVAMLSEGEVSL